MKIMKTSFIPRCSIVSLLLKFLVVALPSCQEKALYLSLHPLHMWSHDDPQRAPSHLQHAQFTVRVGALVPITDNLEVFVVVLKS